MTGILELYTNIDFKTTNFDIIANLLLNKYIIRIDRYTFRITDIEFYLNCCEHKDTNVCQNDVFKQFGNFKLAIHNNGSLKSGEDRALLITLGDDSKYFYCKINSMINVSTRKIILEPNNVVNKIMRIMNYNNLTKFNDEIIMSDKIYEYLKLEQNILNIEIIYCSSRINDYNSQYQNKYFRYLIMILGVDVIQFFKSVNCIKLSERELENKLIIKEHKKNPAIFVDPLKLQIDSCIIDSEVIAEYTIDDKIELDKLHNIVSNISNIESKQENKKFVSKLVKSSMYDNISCLGNIKKKN
jgi:ferredoxin-like protein FixX